MILFPAIDIKGGKCVRLSQGDFAQVTTYSEDPVKVAKRWKAEGAQWLHIVDLDGARMGMPNTANLEVLRQIVRQVGLPIQFWRRGAQRGDRGAAAQYRRDASCRGHRPGEGPRAGGRSLHRLRRKGGRGSGREGRLRRHSGLGRALGEQATAFVARMSQLGAKRFIFTDIARDGMLQGVNMVSLAQVAAVVPNHPVIASGGVSSVADLEALRSIQATSTPNIEGVIVGKALYAGAVSLPEAIAALGNWQWEMQAIGRRQ